MNRFFVFLLLTALAGKTSCTSDTGISKGNWESKLSEPNKKLLSAIWQGHYSELRPAINAGANFSTARALKAAVEVGDGRMVDTLLEMGADPNKQYGDELPLTTAVKLKKLNLISRLAQVTDPKSVSAIKEVAYYKGDKDVVKAIEEGLKHYKGETYLGLEHLADYP